MSFAYFARQSAGTDSLTPSGWTYGFQYPADANSTPYPTTPISGGAIPGIPFPLNWPQAAVSGTDLVLSAPATISLGTHAATIECEIQINGSNTGTSAYLHHLIQLTASEGGVARSLRKSGVGSYTTAIYYKVSNYTGSKYGFSATVDFDPADWTDLDNIDVLAKMVTVTANPDGTDTFQVTYP